MRALRYIALLSGILLLAGCKSCKYSLSGINIPPDVKNISVQYFENKASLVNPSLSQKFTEQLKDKFLRQTSLAIIPSEGDYRLSGYVSEYKTEPVATNNSAALKNRFTMSVYVVFECPKHKEMNFTETITKFLEFPATSTFQSLESSLSEDVSGQIIQEIYNKVALKW